MWVLVLILIIASPEFALCQPDIENDPAAVVRLREAGVQSIVTSVIYGEGEKEEVQDTVFYRYLPTYTESLHIRQRIRIDVKRPGKVLLCEPDTLLYRFNLEGKLLEKYNKSSCDNRWSALHFTYGANGKVQTYTSHDQGELTDSTLYTYTPFGEINSMTTYQLRAITPRNQSMFYYDSLERLVAQVENSRDTIYFIHYATTHDTTEVYHYRRAPGERLPTLAEHFIEVAMQEEDTQHHTLLQGKYRINKNRNHQVLIEKIVKDDLLETSLFDSTGALLLHQQWQYDRENRLVKTTSTFSTQPDINKQEEYLYNGEGNLQATITYRGEDRKKEKTIRYYYNYY